MPRTRLFAMRQLITLEGFMYPIEMTDTFGGEANYSWVRRGEIRADAKTSRLAIVRRAKRWAGLSGVRCDVCDFGDTIEIRPRGRCVVVFVG